MPALIRALSTLAPAWILAASSLPSMSSMACCWAMAGSFCARIISAWALPCAAIARVHRDPFIAQADDPRLLLMLADQLEDRFEDPRHQHLAGVARDKLLALLGIAGDGVDARGRLVQAIGVEALVVARDPRAGLLL